jgi:hypothetical protein
MTPRVANCLDSHFGQALWMTFVGVLFFRGLLEPWLLVTVGPVNSTDAQVKFTKQSFSEMKWYHDSLGYYLLNVHAGPDITLQG